MLNLAPIFYMDKLGCTETAAGAWIAMANSTTASRHDIAAIWDAFFLYEYR